MAIELPRIEMSGKHKRDLAEKHHCTDQAVRNALRYISDSEQARNIRKAAKKMLLAEAAKVQIKVNP